jgi:hypothetical protein
VVPLAEAAPVDFFRKNLWDRALPEGWGDELLGLDEQQLIGLPSLKCEFCESDHPDPSSPTPSLAEFIRTARRLCLVRDGDWAVHLHDESGDSGEDATYPVGRHAHPSEVETSGRGGGVYGWMCAKKKEEVMGMQGVVAGVATSHGTTCVADIGSGAYETHPHTHLANVHFSEVKARE